MSQKQQDAGVLGRGLSAIGLVISLGMVGAQAASPDDIFVRAGASWDFWDNGTAPPNDGANTWRSLTYAHTVTTPNNATDWCVGPAQMGYGDGDESTTVLFGPDANNKYITTYFRRIFTVTGASAYRSLNIKLLRDDGGVVYINGTEVFRSNMGGTVGTPPAFGALASGSPSTADESRYYEVILNLTAPPWNTLLLEGNNVIAAEVHQNAANSSDLSFNLELIGFKTVTRGPYLQSGSPTAVTVKWNTLAAERGYVRYGTSVASLSDPAQSSVVYEPSAVPGGLHSRTITGLQPDTLYYYSFGRITTPDWASEVVLEGNDVNHFVLTAPTPGTQKPTRVWVLGDSGDYSFEQVRRVRNAYFTLANAEQRHTDLWLMLGDNAYETGTETEFQKAVFDMFPDMLTRSVLWSTVGNHELNHVNSAPGAPYWSIHTFPTLGEAGGVASGSEAYYSFDYANIHFICLNSQDSTALASDGAMALWLEQDLAENNKEWTIAFYHHPPYSRGTHNSDTVNGDGARMRLMRENFQPILEAGGVDLVLNGHSHVYERSYLLDGHYKTAGGPVGVNDETSGAATVNTFTPGMLVQGTKTGRDSQKYTKAPFMPHAGTVYTVAGSSSKGAGGNPIWVRTFQGTTTVIGKHPANYISLDVAGSLVIDANGRQLDVRFVRENGVIDDYFTIVKEYDTIVAAGGNMLVPWDINLFGEIAGSYDNNGYQAALWRSPTVTPIPVRLHARGINDLSEVVGEDFNAYSRGWKFDGASSAYNLLGALGGSTDSSWPWKINTFGQIVGTSGTDSGVSKAYRTRPAPNNTVILSTDSLGTFNGGATWGNGINDKGQVAGTAWVPGLGLSHACRYSDGIGWEDLNELTLNSGLSASAHGINARGWIAGLVGADGPGFIVKDGGAGMVFFGSGSGLEMNVSKTLNNFGVTVGFYFGSGTGYAYAARNGRMINLNDYRPASALGYNFFDAFSANNAGQIVGSANSDYNPAYTISAFPADKPVVTIVSPLYGSVYAPGNITLQARAGDLKATGGGAGSLSTVQFLNGSTQIGSTITTSGTRQNSLSTTWNATKGRYMISALVIDGQGKRSFSDPVLVSVTTAPAVAINSIGGPMPVNAVNLSGTFSDADGTVRKVEIWEGIIKRGEITSLTSGVWSFNWTGPSASVGWHYNITARATDDSGATAKSAPVTIQIVP